MPWEQTWGLGFFLSHGWAQYSIYWGIKWNQLVDSFGLTTASSLSSVHSFRHVYITTSLPWNSFLVRLFSLRIQSSLSLCVFVCVCVTYLQTSLKLSFQGTGLSSLDHDHDTPHSPGVFCVSPYLLIQSPAYAGTPPRMPSHFDCILPSM